MGFPESSQASKENMRMNALPKNIEKQELRNSVWKLLDETGVSRFPKPVSGRIPNFEGAEKAAQNLSLLQEFQDAQVLKVNPDSPQRPVRRLALQSGQLLLMPSPRLRRGFIMLAPREMPSSVLMTASSIRGAFKHGRLISLSELPKIDLIVVGSVAVSPEGSRIGKGGGYSEIEYAILRELRLVDDSIPIATTVHELQVLERIPMENHDISVDIIVTPKRVIRNDTLHRPAGIIWNKITPKMLARMPVLKELKRNNQEQV